MSKANFGRRQTLQLLGLSGAGYLLNGCVPRELTQGVGSLVEPLNLKVGELILKAETPVPEFPVSAIEPDALLINTFESTPRLDPATFRLTIDGDVETPMQLSLADIQKIPLTSMVIRHICVEGWSAIVQWGGVRVMELAKLVKPKAEAKYIFFESADNYYESWDVASALHPQTLLAYQKNGAPISVDNGAPLRLASPVKLGYKQSKWVTRITFMSQLRPQKGYWEDQGYEWFGGI